MNARRWLLLLGAIGALIAMVAWIGEIDLGIDDALQTPPAQQS